MAEEYVYFSPPNNWTCRICGFTSTSRGEVLRHVRREHREYLAKKNDGIGGYVRDRQILECFKDLSVTAVTRAGILVRGRLKAFSETYILIEDAIVEGSRHRVKVERIALDRHVLSHIHTEPVKVEEKE